MRLAVIFDRFGPYHIARLKAAALCTDLTGIEIAGRSDEYAWARISDVSGFRQCTLFPDASSKAVSQRNILHALELTLADIKPDVVAIPGWGTRAGLMALKWSLAHDIPLIMMAESTLIDQWREPIKEAVKGSLISLAGAALVGGERTAKYVMALGMPAERIFVGYDVVDNAYFVEETDRAKGDAAKIRLTLQLPQRYFLASSRFVPKKNLTRLLLAYSQYKAKRGERGWKLVILGDGPLRGKLLRQRSRLHLESDVIFPGFVQYDQLPLYYGLAGAFVHASIVEQWGLVVNEALAAALPVLVSNRCGCVPELVHDGENGFLFDPLNIGELSRLLDLVSRTPDLQKMGRRSRSIIQGWSPAKFAE